MLFNYEIVKIHLRNLKRLLLSNYWGQPYVPLSILGWWEFKFVEIKGHAYFQAGIITEYPKYIDKLSNSPEPLGQFQTNWAPSILGWKGFNIIQIRSHALFQGEIITNSKNKLMKFLLQNYLANFNHTWHKAILGSADWSLFLRMTTLFAIGKW